MTDKKCVLIIGLDPTLIDFSQPGYAPGMDAMKVLAGLKSSEDELTRLGYNVRMCLTDFGVDLGVRSCNNTLYPLQDPCLMRNIET